MKIRWIAHPEFGAFDLPAQDRAWLEGVSQRLQKFGHQVIFHYPHFEEKMLDADCLHYFSFSEGEIAYWAERAKVPVVMTPALGSEKRLEGFFRRLPKGLGFWIPRLLRALRQRTWPPTDDWRFLASSSAVALWDGKASRQFLKRFHSHPRHLVALDPDPEVSAGMLAGLYQNLINEKK